MGNDATSEDFDMVVKHVENETDFNYVSETMHKILTKTATFDKKDVPFAESNISERAQYLKLLRFLCYDIENAAGNRVSIFSYKSPFSGNGVDAIRNRIGRLAKVVHEQVFKSFRKVAHDRREFTMVTINGGIYKYIMHYDINYNIN